MPRAAPLGRFLPQAGVAREPGVFLLRPLLAAEMDLLGVDHHHAVAAAGRAACRWGDACPSGSWRCRWPGGRRPCRSRRPPTTSRRSRPAWRCMSSFLPLANLRLTRLKRQAIGLPGELGRNAYLTALWVGGQGTVGDLPVTCDLHGECPKPLCRLTLELLPNKNSRSAQREISKWQPSFWKKLPRWATLSL